MQHFYEDFWRFRNRLGLARLHARLSELRERMGASSAGGLPGAAFTAQAA
jgi:hypothetical protein